MAKSTTARSTTSRKTPSGTRPAGPARLVRTPRKPDHAQIASRAYALFVESGSRHGHDVEHWLQAEQELRERVLTSAA